MNKKEKTKEATPASLAHCPFIQVFTVSASRQNTEVNTADDGASYDACVYISKYRMMYGTLPFASLRGKRGIVAMSWWQRRYWYKNLCMI